ncbi:MAG: aldo/keto reductase [Clostridiales bacterium]|nr:aldo/keto reductase [Clostridiales bacterium]
MKYIQLGTSGLNVSQIALGCMRLTGLSVEDAGKLIGTAMEQGINFFDHADIYANGEEESHFAKAVKMSPSVREKMIIQSKCSIRPGVCYDFSKEHILSSVDASLKRLNTEYLDVLLLHRPDTLMEPEEVAEAFHTLKEQGKVRYFGVSNQNPMQMELLSRYCEDKLVTDQLQFSITNCGMVDAGLNVNMVNQAGVVRDGGVLEYCRLKQITIQAWSPFQYGVFEGVFLGNMEKYPKLNQVIDRIAEQYGVTNSAIAVAWISRHPAALQTIVGTTNRGRLEDICASSDVRLTREEWYEIYLAAGKDLP